MVVENLGPCACCDPCKSCPGTDKRIKISISGHPDLDGDYFAIYDAGVSSAEGESTWVTEIGGFTVWVSCRSESGGIVFDMARGNPPTTGCETTVACGVEDHKFIPLEAANDPCWFDAVGINNCWVTASPVV